MRIVSDFSPEHEELADAIRINSRINYGSRRETIENLIEKSLTLEPEKPFTEETDWQHRKRLLDQPVENLELSVRTFNTLKRTQIKTVRQLISRSENDLRETEKFSLKSVNEIKEILQKCGLMLQAEDFESNLIISNTEGLVELVFDDDDF